MDSRDDEMAKATHKPLPVESDNGNIEYKRRLDEKNCRGFEKLRSQMLYRMDEGLTLTGSPDAIYYLGIEDDGTISGLKLEELQPTLTLFLKLVDVCYAMVILKRIFITEYGDYVNLVVRKSADIQLFNEVRIALVGPPDAGKTTLLGTITSGESDNGDGSARSSIFRYDHEMEEGVTSSIKHEIIGFKDGQIINYSTGFMYGAEDIACNSDKLISFVDLPGELKYNKTMIFGLLATKPDYIFLLWNQEVDSYQSYLDICQRLEIPIIMVETKSDIYQPIDKDMVHYIDNESDITTMFDQGKIPCIRISNVDLDLKIIHSVLNYLEIISAFNNDIQDEMDGTEFVINDIFDIPDVGIVVNGILNSGSIKMGDKLMIGPYQNSFSDIEITSIHKKQVPSKKVYPGESATLMIHYDVKKIKPSKHQMILSDDLVGNVVNQFYVKVNNGQLRELEEGHNVPMFVRNVYDPITVDDKEEYADYYLLSVKFDDHRVNYLDDGEKCVFRLGADFIIGIISLN